MVKPTPDDVVIGRRVRVEQRMLARRDGRRELREMVVHPGSVVVLPLLDDGRIVMIQNHRFTIGSTLLELCAGTRELAADGTPEDPASCAARELEEETGYRAGELTALLGFYPSPGMSDEFMQVFVARRLVNTAQKLDQSEQIVVALHTPDEVLAQIHNGVIRDAKTIAAMLFFHTWRQITD